MLNTELDVHLEGEAAQAAGHHRNGASAKTVLTDDGALPLSIPRDRHGCFDPMLIAKYQRRFLTWMFAVFTEELTPGFSPLCASDLRRRTLTDDAGSYRHLHVRRFRFRDRQRARLSAVARLRGS